MPRKLSARQYKNNSIRIEREGAKALRAVVNQWMADMRKAMNTGLNKLISKDIGQQIAIELIDWEEIEAKGLLTIKPAILSIINKAGANTQLLFDATTPFDVVSVQATELAETITANMVREVTTETQKAIATIIRTEMTEGRSIPQIAKKLKPLVGLTEKQIISVANFEEKYIIRFPEANQERIDRAVDRFAKKKHRQRTETISRTIASEANAEGSLNRYETEGVKVEWIAVTGNDFDPEFCQDNNGKVFTIAEARGMIPVHPNCECIFGPHVETGAIAA